MLVNKFFTYLTVHISQSKRCFNVKHSTYHFHMKTKILADFQICISVPLGWASKQSEPAKHLRAARHRTVSSF